MSSTAPSPMLSAERRNRLVAEAREYLRTRVRQGLRQLMQDGYLPYSEPPPKLEELRALLERHEQHMQLVADEMQPAGLRQRAVQALVREYELREELFGA